MLITSELILELSQSGTFGLSVRCRGRKANMDLAGDNNYTFCILIIEIF